MLSCTLKLKCNPIANIHSYVVNITLRCRYRYIHINNYNATKIIKSTNTKHKKNKTSKPDALRYVLAIFKNISSPKTYHSMNALLHLLYDWECPQHVTSMWHDIQSYHQSPTTPNKFSYALLIKCLIQSQDIQKDKYLTTLQWIQQYDYKLSIHGSLLNKLILKMQNDLNALRYIHTLIDEERIEVDKDDIIVKTVLINAFAMCGSIATNDALNIFNSIDETQRDNASIGAMMKVYVNNHCHVDAFELYDRYKHTDNPVLHRLAVKACIQSNDFVKGKQLHSLLKDNEDVYLRTTLIDLYGHFNDIQVAQDIFNSIKHHQNVFSINAMMKAFINNGCVDQALGIFNSYRITLDDISYALMLKACCQNNRHHQIGQNIISEHGHIMRSNNIVLKRALMEFYGVYGDVTSVLKIFRSIKEDKMDVFCVNGLLSALVGNGYHERALQFYMEYEQWTDSVSHVFAIKSYIATKNQEKGYQIIDRIMNEDNNLCIQSKNALIEYYGHFGDMDKALQVFNTMNDTQDVITISALMSAYIKNERFQDALSLYDSCNNTLHDDVSHVLALKACGKINNEQKGRYIIDANHLLKSTNLHIQNSLISFFGNCHQIINALEVFDGIRIKDIVSVNSMMDAYRDCMMCDACVALFKEIGNGSVGVVSCDLLSFIIAIKACTQGNLWCDGQWIHEHQLHKEEYKWMLHDISIQIHLIRMYGKAGKLQECEQIFDDIQSGENDKYKHDIHIWNAMLYVYGRNGELAKVKQCYDVLMEIGVIPNRKTYVLLIDAHMLCGDMDGALNIWNNEIEDNIKHDQRIMTALKDAMCDA
eukprot:259810_1